jgi:hypothetical protein
MSQANGVRGIVWADKAWHSAPRDRANASIRPSAYDAPGCARDCAAAFLLRAIAHAYGRPGSAALSMGSLAAVPVRSMHCSVT